ncbi:MAG: cysteine-rich CWC family protein [Proteobacteria bacterium]|nr:cysteine-rich CWC family protein [Pseudomonadota bacterium]
MKTVSDNSRCRGCGTNFSCGVKAGTGQCWCMSLPAVPLPADAGKEAEIPACYCPACLSRIRSEAVSAGHHASSGTLK